MKKPILFLLLLAGMAAAINLQAQANTVDICVYGGTSGGVIAAYTAKKMGKSVLLIEPGRQAGGLTTGGLGYTDIGNKYVVTGLARDFYRRVGVHYGKFETWIFAPCSVGSIPTIYTICSTACFVPAPAGSCYKKGWPY